MQMAIIPRTQQGHGWLRPAIGVVELSQSIIQVCLEFQSSIFLVQRSQGAILAADNCSSSCHIILFSIQKLNYALDLLNLSYYHNQPRGFVGW